MRQNDRTLADGAGGTATPACAEGSGVTVFATLIHDNPLKNARIIQVKHDSPTALPGRRSKQRACRRAGRRRYRRRRARGARNRWQSERWSGRPRRTKGSPPMPSCRDKRMSAGTGTHSLGDVAGIAWPRRRDHGGLYLSALAMTAVEQAAQNGLKSGAQAGGQRFTSMVPDWRGRAGHHTRQCARRTWVAGWGRERMPVVGAGVI